MGGRGASSGISKKGHKYGDDYKSLFTSGNIKFVIKKRKDAESLMETRTKNRVYVLVSKTGTKGNEKLCLKSIVYMGKDLMRKKSTDLDHKHKGMQPHTHHGYQHNENDSQLGAAHLTTKEKVMKNRVERLWAEWYSHYNK